MSQITELQEDADWFKDYYQGSTLGTAHLYGLVLKLRTVAETVGFSFRTEVAKSNAWIFANPRRRPKRNWCAFYTKWFAKAKPDGRTTDSTFRKELAYLDS